MKITQSTVSVKDIEIYAYHGVYEHERENGGEFKVSVSLDFDARAAMEYDDLEATVNYAQVVDLIHDVMIEPSQLIEHVCYRIINALSEAFPMVIGGMVSVTKVKPPITTPTAGATFTASFTH